MTSPKELPFLTRDFWRFATGTDYFRQPQPLGAYFTDPRCYYNDLRGKAEWRGPCLDGLPAYCYAQTGERVLVPIMLLNYGLGSIDRFFVEQDERYLPPVRRVAQWLLDNLLPEGCYHNRLTDRDRGHEYYSHNSSMVQGEVLSFAVRAIRHGLVEAATAQQLQGLMERVFANMVLPLDRGGTAWEQGNDLVFCEFCRKDRCVVLNGWIYTWFGLRDYAPLAGGDHVRQVSEATCASMQRWLPRFQRADGWAYYDDRGRVCSPFYQDLHIALMEALCRLTGAPVFRENMLRSIEVNTRWRRTRYTLSKIRDKLCDRQAYGSQA